jgi:hypothetical protein
MMGPLKSEVADCFRTGDPNFSYNGEFSTSLMCKVNLMLHPYALHGEITLNGRTFQIATMHMCLRGTDVDERTGYRVWIFGLPSNFAG